MHPVQPVVQEGSGLTDIEILLQSMLPVVSMTKENVRPPSDRQELTAGCFSCGESGHATSQCPVLDESFLFLPPGWRIGRTMKLHCGHPRGGLTVIKRETSTDPVRGVGPDQ